MLVNLNDILPAAQKGHYAVGLFNTTDTDMLEAVITAAEEMRSPVIIGTAEVLLPHGELKLIVPAMIAAAKSALYTGHPGDGKIFLYDVEEVVRVRTGEMGKAALTGADGK